MKILVTAGNTQTMIDRVRCITNIFSGRTGAQIATKAYDQGHQVTLLTSHPHVVEEISSNYLRADDDLQVVQYQTFEDLESLMAEHIQHGNYDVVIHAAAVNDYHVVGTFARNPSTTELIDVSRGKIKSCHEELWIQMRPAPKLVDKIRSQWGFNGTLVKFKLEVGRSDGELVEIAQEARVKSDADFLVANTLEGMQKWAVICSRGGKHIRIQRQHLAAQLIELISERTKHVRDDLEYSQESNHVSVSDGDRPGCQCGMFAP